MKPDWRTGKMTMSGVDNVETAGYGGNEIVGVGTYEQGHTFLNETRIGECTYDIRYLIALLKKMKRHGVDEVAVSYSDHKRDPGSKMLIFRDDGDLGIIAALGVDE